MGKNCSSGFFQDSPSLVLDGLNMKCLDVDFWVFIVLRVVWVSWICALLSDINSENFSAVTSHVFFLSCPLWVHLPFIIVP